MNLADICTSIKQLIKEIFASEQQLNDNRAIESEKSSQAANLGAKLLVDIVQKNESEIAKIQIRHGNKRLINEYSKQVIWHREYGLAVESKTGQKPIVEPFPVDSVNFSVVVKLAEKIESELKYTLNKINNENERITNRTQQFDKLIELLQDFDKD